MTKKCFQNANELLKVLLFTIFLHSFVCIGFHISLSILVSGSHIDSSSVVSS
jgi:hypothetical protein